MLGICGANAFQSSPSHSAYGHARHKKFAPGKIRWMASRPFAFRAHFNPAAGHALRRRGGANDTSIRFFTSPVGMWIGVRLEPLCRPARGIFAFRHSNHHRSMTAPRMPGGPNGVARDVLGDKVMTRRAAGSPRLTRLVLPICGANSQCRALSLRFSGWRSRSLSLGEGLTDSTGARDGTRADGVLDRGRRRIFSF